LLVFASPLEILPFDDHAALHYGDIRAYLERLGQSIGAMDMLIAAHARSIPLTLMTNNACEFSRVPHLRVENWV
jgi:tRNA(fMet)-specific endonuclease VapC